LIVKSSFLEVVKKV